MSAFDLATALDKGACAFCSTASRIVFHHESTLRPSPCPEARMVEGRRYALRALPWLESVVGRP